MQFDALSDVFFDGGEEEGEVLFDITKIGTAKVATPTDGPEIEDGGDVDDTEVKDEHKPSFGDVIADHYDQMVVNARHLTGDTTRADDVVQESMIRAMRAWDRFLEAHHAYRDEHRYESGAMQDFDDAVGRWLHRIVTNAFINLYHHNKRSTRRMAQWTFAQRACGETSTDPRDHLDSPVGDEVARAMATLNGDHRKVVEMHYLHGMDCADIAAELGCAKNTVFTRLARARETLGPLLRRYAKERYGIGSDRSGRAKDEPTPPRTPSPAGCVDDDDFDFDDEDAA